MPIIWSSLNMNIKIEWDTKLGLMVATCRYFGGTFYGEGRTIREAVNAVMDQMGCK